MFYKENDNSKFSLPIDYLMLQPDKEKAQEVQGDDLYFGLLEIEPETLLDKTLFRFLDHCFKINEVLANMGFSLNFLKGATCTDF